MAIEGMIRRIRNIMRQDEGVGGDGHRIEQIVWLLFLKIFDDQETVRELEDENYTSPLPENLRWRNWAADKEGITGEELLTFVDVELFPTFKKLETDTDEGRFISSMFEDCHNYMKSGTLMRQVINEINQIDFNKQSERHLLNDIYESILKGLQSAGSYGEYYTPRPLTQFIVEMVNPTLGEKILDPACGTGGFLVNALEYLRKSVKTEQQEHQAQRSIHGHEIKHLPHLLASTNLILHGVEIPDNIARGDMLAQPLTEYGPSDRVDVILANPPFGGAVKDGTENNFPTKFRTKSTAELFLVLFIHLLKNGGRAGIVLPDGSLFGEGVLTEIKKHLLQNCNLHTIIRLPKGVFNPYAGVNTNLLFFTKGEPTEEIWYYHMPLPSHLKNGYTKTKPIANVEFEPIKQWWHNRVENEFAHKVSIEEIIKRGYNLDVKNPHVGEQEEELSSQELIKRILEREGVIIETTKSL